MIFFVPGFSQFGFLLGVIALNRRSWRAHRPNLARAIVAIVIGFGVTATWVLMMMSHRR